MSEHGFKITPQPQNHVRAWFQGASNPSKVRVISGREVCYKTSQQHVLLLKKMSYFL